MTVTDDSPVKLLQECRLGQEDKGAGRRGVCARAAWTGLTREFSKQCGMPGRVRLQRRRMSKMALLVISLSVFPTILPTFKDSSVEKNHKFG